MKPTKKGVKKGVKKEPTQQPKVEATPTKETTPVPTTTPTTQTTETAPVPTTTPTTETTPSPTTETTPTPTPETPTPAPYQLTPTELLAKQRQQEENKNLYIFAVNKKIKAINKKISKIQKLEQLQKSGKELENKQLETIERLKTHQKKLANWEELKKNYIQIWENQKTNDPSKLIFSLINAIAVETKAHNDKFAVQTGRLSKLRDLFFKEATGFSDFQKTVDNSLSLLQKFIESSNDVAFDEITFKQLRADLLEVTLAINGFAQLESNKNKKLEKKRLKEQEEQERKLKEEQQKNQAQSGNQKGGNRNNNNKGGNRNNNNNRNRDNNNRNRDNNNRNRDNNNRNRDNNRDNNNKN